MPKILWVAIIVIIVILGVLFMGGGSSENVSNTLVEEVSETENLKEGSIDDTPTVDEVGFESDNPVDTTGVGKTHLVSYKDNGYEPKEITVALGDTVIFENNSDKDLWTASAQHPTHTAYDDSHKTSLCSNDIGGTNVFDQCQTGDSFAFTFNKLGEWAYHNHVSPRDFGQIIVIE